MDRDLEAAFAKKITLFRHNPLGFVRTAFPWGEGELLKSAGPRSWQKEVLEYIGQHLQNPATRYTPCLIATSSGHGIGKSALVSMLTLWAMCLPDTKCVLTAGTEVQLRSKLWPECAKWHRMAVNSHWFNFGATSLTSRDPRHQRTWRADIIAWSETSTESFAGLHNQGKRILVVFDEASAIGDEIWETTEGTLTDEHTEILWCAFGNPTRNTGRFRECFGRLKHRWHDFQIDSRRVEGTNSAQLQSWVDDYGEDSDFVRVRVRGEFPRAGSTQLIPIDVVEQCRKYHDVDSSKLPKILSIDVARFGDDMTVIGLRQGRKFEVLGKYRNLDTVQVAERVIMFQTQHEPEATIIDADGVGGGVVDQIRYRGFNRGLYEFHGGHRANDPTIHFNLRAQMWCEMRDWLKNGAQIPDDPELAQDLCGLEYGFSTKGAIQLEKKEDMKRRSLSSPDLGDCLAMSFAVRVAARPKPALKLVYSFPNPNSWMGG
jgi:hypothetical protein